MTTHDSQVLSERETGFRVLLLDGHGRDRDLLFRLLSGNGCRVVICERAGEAMDVLERVRVDMMIMDLALPDRDGFQVLAEVRQRFGLTRMPVIALSSQGGDELQIKALNMGANDFITKPLHGEVALARIQTQRSLVDAERGLRESEERYALAARGAKDGLWDWNLKTNQIFFSVRWKEMLGLNEDDVSASPDEWFDRIHPDDLDRIQTELQQHLAGETEHFSCECRLLHQDGAYRWVFSRGHALRDSEGAAYRIAGSQTDITYQNQHDTLTGLPKRSLFLHTLARAANRNRGQRGERFAVHYLDLVRFKRINDSGGYEAGDEVLIRIKKRLETCLSPQDTLARLEGGDFVILQSFINTDEEAYLLASGIRQAVGEPLFVGDQRVRLEVSIAIVPGRCRVDAPEDILRNAQTAMFHVKGRGRTILFGRDMQTAAVEKVTLERYLREAVANNELSLHFQPQVALKGETLAGLEVLLRWRHRELGWVAPEKFIPLAEETGLIVPIGDWVLHRAFEQARAWQRAGFMPVRLAINFSARQFSQLNICERISSALEETGFDPAFFEIEITESVIMENIVAASMTIENIKALGVSIAIDDFGTGYSSLEYLKKFSLDCLKIDKSFVRDISTNGEDASITAAIIAMAHNLGLKVIAEGVEDREQIHFLQSCGCEMVQGAYYSMPVRAEQVIKYLERRNLVSRPGA